MVAAKADQYSTPSISVAYETVVADWTRVTRSFVRSLHAYRRVQAVQAQRQERSTARPRAVQRATTLDALNLPPAPALAAAPVEPARLAPPERAAPPTCSPTEQHKRPLTSRQMEIANLIARGLSNAEIADELVLTPGTVGNHIGHILRRLGARNRAQVASWFTQANPLNRLGGES